MTEPDSAPLASELRVVLGQLVRRLRAEKQQLPLTHSSVLARLDREGPRCASDLAAAERMRPQSMAQALGELEEHGFIARTPDPDDRRRALVALTPAGRETLGEQHREREGWLARAKVEELSQSERDSLTAALAVLRKLAES
jgi:DNA-binding MarR family transcriptional regulator